MTTPIKMLDLGALQLPILDFAIQGTAILGIKESGKSYSGTYVAERFCDAQIPWICFDPVGIWRWMRVAGKGPGARAFPVVVAGGRTPDIALTVENAPTIIRMAMRRNVNLVVDLFDPEISKKTMRRIVSEGCQLLLHENPEYGLRHVFFEEAADLVPQRVMGDMAPTYGAIEELCRKGGNSQLGYTLVSTRPEDINKSVLELCDALLLHRQKGKNSILGLKKWLATIDPQMAERIGKTLGTLGPGQCWVWARETTEPLLTQIPAKQSHHPDRRQQSSPLSTMKGVPAPRWHDNQLRDFIDETRTLLQEAEEDRRQPVLAPAARVKARVAEAQDLQDLQQQIDENRLKTTEEAIQERERKSWEVGRQHGFQQGYGAGTATIEGMLHGVIQRSQGLLELLREISQELSRNVKAGPPPQGGVIKRQTLEEWAHTHRTAATPEYILPTKAAAQQFAGRVAGTATVKDGEVHLASLATMRVLAILANVHPLKLTMNEWAARAGMSASGGTWGRYIRQLMKAGYIERHGKFVCASDSGHAAAGIVDTGPPRDREALLADWQQKLGEGCGRVLEHMARHFESQFSREQLADDLGMSASGGAFGGYIRVLERNALIEKIGNRLFQVAEPFRKRRDSK